MLPVALVVMMRPPTAKIKKISFFFTGVLENGDLFNSCVDADYSELVEITQIIEQTVLKSEELMLGAYMTEKCPGAP